MRNNEHYNTLTLLKFALKRDRIRALIWIGGIGGMIFLFTLMFQNLLTTTEEIATMTVAQSSSPGTRLFLAPASGVSLGGFTMLRVSTTIITIFGLFNFLTVIRHTRQSEDLGRLELLGSTAVGRSPSESFRESVCHGRAPSWQRQASVCSGCFSPWWDPLPPSWPPPHGGLPALRAS